MQPQKYVKYPKHFPIATKMLKATQNMCEKCILCTFLRTEDQVISWPRKKPASTNWTLSLKYCVLYGFDIDLMHEVRRLRRFQILIEF